MQHFRRTLLTILVLATVVASLVGYAGNSSALPSRNPRDPMTPATPPTGFHDPNTGEPDAGSTRSQQVDPNADRIHQAYGAQPRARALRMIRWTSFVWAKRILGVGE